LFFAMHDGIPPSSNKRLLDPVERTSEVLFGLIMALSFTCSISAAEEGEGSVRTMLIGAIGCNVAWGVIDAVIYLMVSLTERARGIATLKAFRRAADPEQARTIVADALPPLLAAAVTRDDVERMREALLTVTEPPASPRLKKQDFLAAAGVFLLVFLATFPVVIPFMFMDDAMTALRVSNGIALAMLFLAGHALGRYAQFRPVRMGLMMMFIGVGLVALTIALGG
jgi:VIT family